MFSTFRMVLVASGRGLCDIVRVLIGVTLSHFVHGHPNFLTRDLLTLDNTLTISHSSHSLAAGPIRNARNMESHLGLTHTI